MIIKNINDPKKSLYIIGSIILKELIINKKHHDPLDLYNETVKSNPNLSISYFYFGLDWLYMINAVELTHSGNIKLCN